MALEHRPPQTLRLRLIVIHRTLTMKIQFIGATREVTGSKHLITTDSGHTILLDCGMYQGKGMETDAANRDLGFDPKTLD